MAIAPWLRTNLRAGNAPPAPGAMAPRRGGRRGGEGVGAGGRSGLGVAAGGCKGPCGTPSPEFICQTSHQTATVPRRLKTGLFFYPSRIIYPSHLFAQSLTFSSPWQIINTLSTLLGLSTFTSLNFFGQPDREALYEKYVSTMVLWPFSRRTTVLQTSFSLWQPPGGRLIHLGRARLLPALRGAASGKDDLIRRSGTITAWCGSWRSAGQTLT